MTSDLADRRRQGLMSGPTATESGRQRSRTDVEHIGPFSERQRASVVRDGVVGAAVSRLLLSRGPSAIARRARAVHVRPAIQRVPWLARTHVAQERLKGGPPLVSHRDPTPAVVGVLRGFWIEAARLGATPTGIFARLALTDCRAVRHRSSSRHILSEAPTTMRCALPEVGRENHDNLPAVAKTPPLRLVEPALFGHANDEQATVSVPRAVNGEWRHGTHCSATEAAA